MNSSRNPKGGKLSKIRGNAYKPFITDFTKDGRKYTQSLLTAVLVQDKTTLDDLNQIDGGQIELEGNMA